MDQGRDSQNQPWLSIENEISGTLAAVDTVVYHRLIAFLSQDDRIFFTGQGRSGLVAQMTAMRFMHLGRQAHFIGEATAPSIRGGDRLLVISGSGKTPISQAFAKIAADEGAEVALLTHASAPEIAAYAGCVLQIPASNSHQFGGSLFEQCALIVLDAAVVQITGQRPDIYKNMARRHTNLQ